MSVMMNIAKEIDELEKRIKVMENHLAEHIERSSLQRSKMKGQIIAIKAKVEELRG